MMEGLFGVMLTLGYSFKENPFETLIVFYKDKEKLTFILLVGVLFLYFVLCGGRNAYRILTNTIYSPMTKSLTDYIINPVLILYYYYFEKDFTIENEQNFFFSLLICFYQLLLYFLVVYIMNYLFCFAMI